MYVVYGLEDPRDGLFHYVGITDDVYKRFIQHIKGSAGNIEKNGWIFGCRQRNIMIGMRELQRIETLDAAIEREKYWVKHYLDLGHPLNNMQIARSILRERARLERQVEREIAVKRRLEVTLKKQAELKAKQEALQEIRSNQSDAPMPPLLQFPVKSSSVYELAVEAWNSGHKSNRAIAKCLGITYYQAQLLCKQIRDSQSA